MASAAETQTVEIADQELVNTVADEQASAAVKRFFTITGRDPF